VPTPMPVEEGGSELRQFLQTLWRRKWWIVSLTAVSFAAAMFYSYRQTPLYQASASVLVRPINFSPTQPGSAGGLIVMETERIIATSPAVGALAAKTLSKEGVSPASVATSNPISTQELIFTSVSPDPRAAQATAQAYADAYLAYRRSQVLKDLEAARQPTQRLIVRLQNQIQEVTQELHDAKTEAERTRLQAEFASLVSQLATQEQNRNELILPENIVVGGILARSYLPNAPFSPDHSRHGMFGLFVGLALGVGLAFTRERLDQRIRGRHELERQFGLPLLTVVPRAHRQGRKGEPVVLSEQSSDVPEAYRILRARLLAARSGPEVKSLLITSSLPAEGKSTTALNLGIALGQANSRVVLVAGDLRNRSLEQLFPSDNGSGLTRILLTGTRVSEELTWTGFNGLWLLPGGPIRHDPQKLMVSSGMGDVMAELKATYDFVVLDTTPVLGLADALVLAPLVDEVLFVVDPKRASRDEIDEAIHQLTSVGASIVGVVLNNVSGKNLGLYHSYYDLYGSGTNGQIFVSPQMPRSSVQ
jgi:capsular exopolysaccharide synthesis family protein